MGLNILMERRKGQIYLVKRRGERIPPTEEIMKCNQNRGWQGDRAIPSHNSKITKATCLYLQSIYTPSSGWSMDLKYADILGCTTAL
jgi:hypothetical protein